MASPLPRRTSFPLLVILCTAVILSPGTSTTADDEATYRRLFELNHLTDALKAGRDVAIRRDAAFRLGRLFSEIIPESGDHASAEKENLFAAREKGLLASAIKALTDASKSPNDEWLRQAAVTALGEVLGAFDDRNILVEREQRNAIRNHLEELVRMASEKNLVRASAGLALAKGGGITDESIIDALSRLLAEENAEVWTRAVNALGKSGTDDLTDRRVVDALSKLIAKDNPLVSKRAVDALGVRGTNYSFDILYQQVSSNVADQAIRNRALGKIPANGESGFQYVGGRLSKSYENEDTTSMLIPLIANGLRGLDRSERHNAAEKLRLAIDGDNLFRNLLFDHMADTNAAMSRSASLVLLYVFGEDGIAKALEYDKGTADENAAVRLRTAKLLTLCRSQYR